MQPVNEVPILDNSRNQIFVIIGDEGALPFLPHLRGSTAGDEDSPLFSGLQRPFSLIDQLAGLSRARHRHDTGVDDDNISVIVHGELMPPFMQSRYHRLYLSLIQTAAD